MVSKQASRPERPRRVAVFDVRRYYFPLLASGAGGGSRSATAYSREKVQAGYAKQYEKWLDREGRYEDYIGRS